MTKFIRTTIAALFVALSLAVVAQPASAQVTVPDCKSVTVYDRVGPDSGENGNDWATVTIDRKTTVCAVEKPTESNWTYVAGVEDSGEFVTLAGNSPGAGTEVKLVGGVRGTVNGQFKAMFTALPWTSETKLVAPDPSTLTGQWIAAVFPGAETFKGDTVTEWRWVYNLCGQDGEWWVNADASMGGNSGDITEKPCPTPSASPSESPSASPSVSSSATSAPTTSAPAMTTSAAPVANNDRLPVTGSTAGTIGLVAAGLIVVGSVLFFVGRRRRAATE